MACKHISLGEFVTNGERLAAEAVREFLAGRSEQWYLFTNGLLPLAYQRREVDQVIVGPTGVFVVDVKSFGGRIQVEGNWWILSGDFRRRDPIGEVDRLARQLKGHLREHSASLSGVWVEGRLLLTCDDIDLSAVPDAAGRCFRLNELDGLVSAPAHVHATLTPNLAQQIVRVLGSGGSLRARHSLGKVGEYSLVAPQPGPETPNRRSFLARNRHGEPALVRVYDLSGVPPSQRQQALAQAQSEFEALDAVARARLPGVVRVLTPFQEVPDRGGELYYFALEQPTGATLADRLADSGWSVPERLDAAIHLCELLSRLHATPIPGRPKDTIVHRRLHPHVIYLSDSPEAFLLTGFDVARSTPQTAYPGAAPFPLTAYDAPELAEGFQRASTRSDIYSLGVLLYRLLGGRLPFGNRPRAAGPDGKPETMPPLADVDVPSGKAGDLTALLDMMTAVTPENRPEDLTTVADLLREMQSQAPADVPARHPLPGGARLTDDLRVVNLLGRGATAWTYHVVEETTGRKWLAKVLREPTELLLSSVGREFGILRMLGHPAIVGVTEVSCRTNAPYHLLLEHCEGSPFTEVFDRVPFIAEERGLSVTNLVLGWADTLLDALSEMHRRGVLHRDISPANLVLTDQGPRIVDFGIAAVRDLDDKPSPALGTFPYRPPECGEGGNWTPGADLYGLAVILCQALLGRLPFEDEQGIRQDRLREELFAAEDPVLSALRRAIDPDPDHRYKMAEQFRRALTGAADPSRAPDQEPDESNGTQPGPKPAPSGWNRVPYLDDLLKVYPASTLGAVETRGLDTPFARETYVETRLDREVRQDILAGKLHLVLLSGNPGDGKTAFLQHLAEQLGGDADAIRGRREWEVLLDSGLVVRMNLDGSAAIGERSSDQVLDEFLEPFFAGPPPGRVHLIAINDGRLLEWLERYEDDDRWLFRNLRALLDEDQPASADPELTLIDLNDRCLVGDVQGGEEGSVARRVLLSLLEGTPDGAHRAGDPWTPCRTCLAAERCPVKFSVDTLRSAAGATVIERAERLLQAVHLQGKVHLTMRQLRGALSYWFFGDAPCEEIHRRLQSVQASDESEEGVEGGSGSSPESEGELYFTRVFEMEQPVLPVLAELKALDPAQVDNPALDRRLFRLSAESLPSVLLPFPDRSPAWSSGPTESEGEETLLRRFRRLRRQVYFEAPANVLRAFGLLDPAEMTPFPGLPSFLEVVTRERDLVEVRSRLAKALSRADRVPEMVIESGERLGIRTHDEASVATTFFRTLPVADFAVEVDPAGSKYLEYLPTHVRLRFLKAAGTDLDISLELFQLLERLYLGYRLGATELDALFANLDVFRHRLLRLPTDRLIAHHPGHGLYTIRTELRDGVRRLILEKEGS